MAKDVDVLSRFAAANDEAVDYINRVDVATSKFRKSQRKGSIVKSAQGNMFEFPVFVSNTIPMDYATATVSLLEQIYAAYLQMAMSINPVVDAASVKRGVQFADYKTNTNKYLEYTDTSYQHDVCHAEYINEDCKVEFDLLSIDDKEAKIINESVDYQPLSEFDHFFQEAPGDSPNMYIPMVPEPVRDANGNIVDPIQFVTNADGQINYITQSELYNMLNGHVWNGHVGANGNISAYQNYMDYIRDNHLNGPTASQINTTGVANMPDSAQTALWNQQARVAQANADKADNPYFKGADYVNTGAQAVNTAANAIKNVATLPSQIKDTRAQAAIHKYNADHLEEDHAMKKSEQYSKMKTSGIQYVDDKKCEKLNTMKPLLMKVTLNMLNKDDSLQPIEYVVGVKCHTRVIPATILPEVAQYPLKEMDKISRKVKWRAGELKFLKDIVFRIKEKKQTAADSRDPNRKWFRRLYELAHMKGDAPAAAVVEGKSLFKVFIKDKQGKGSLQNGMIPNASIIMTQTDVDNIKAETKIDLLKPGTAKKFCGELFLMSFIIIDTDRESIKILLPDMNNDFDVHSLAAVNKQLATLDTAGTKTRDMFKLLGA
jgi:hypothetical protein